MELNSRRWRFLTSCGDFFILGWWPLPPETRDQRRPGKAKSAALLDSSRCVLRAHVCAMEAERLGVWQVRPDASLCVFTQEIWRECYKHGCSSGAHCLCRLIAAFMLSQHILNTMLASCRLYDDFTVFFLLVHYCSSNIRFPLVSYCNDQILSYADHFTHLNHPYLRY